MYPHDPYIAAVAAALGPDAEIDFTEYQTTESYDTERWLLVAHLQPDGDDAETVGLHWDTDNGWTWGPLGDHGEWRWVNDLPVEMLASPARVAAVLTAIRERREPVYAPQEFPPTPAELPAPVQAALDDGDIDRDTADHLAAYWPTTPGTTTDAPAPSKER